MTPTFDFGGSLPEFLIQEGVLPVTVAVNMVMLSVLRSHEPSVRGDFLHRLGEFIHRNHVTTVDDIGLVVLAHSCWTRRR